jgi:hypothetical protein
MLGSAIKPLEGAFALNDIVLRILGPMRGLGHHGIARFEIIRVRDSLQGFDDEP